MIGDEKESVFKNLATLLSLVLPVAQVFVTLLPTETKKTILFSQQLLLVSVLAALMAYVFIVAFRSTVWFRLTFQRARKKKYDAQHIKFQNNVYSDAERNQLIIDEKIAIEPYYITPLNVYYFLLPLVIIFTLVFLFLGMFFPGTHQNALIFIQAVVYMLVISLVSLLLGVFYINDINRARRDKLQATSWDRVKWMLFNRWAIPEFPSLDFVAEVQFMQGSETRIRTIVSVNKISFYAVDTDLDRKHMYEINNWKPDDNTLNALGSIR